MIIINLPDLSKKQKIILYLLYQFRFLTINHLKKLLGHKNHHRINEWLNDLVTKGCIISYFNRKLSPEPGYYFLTAKSVAILRTMEGVDKKALRLFNREHKKKKRFINHSFLVAEIFIHYLDLAQGDQVQFLTRTQMDSDEFMMEQKPDAYISISSNGQVLKRYFLEIIDPGTFKKIAYNRIDQYIKYAEQDEWQRTTGHPFPDVLVVCPDLELKHKIFRFLKAVMNEHSYADITFHLATREVIKYHGVVKSVWQRAGFATT